MPTLYLEATDSEGWQDFTYQQLGELTEQLLKRDIQLGADVILGDQVFLGRSCVIGNGAMIGSQVRVGRQAKIGCFSCLLDGAELSYSASVEDYSLMGVNSFLGEASLLRQGASLGVGSEVGRGCIIGQQVCIGQGCIVMAGCNLGGEKPTNIGDFVYIGRDCRILEGAVLHMGVTLGRACWIGPGVLLAATTRLASQTNVSAETDRLLTECPICSGRARLADRVSMLWQWENKLSKISLTSKE